MVNAMDRSYADQSTLHGEDPMAVTFMDSHNYNNRCGFTVLFSFTQSTCVLSRFSSLLGTLEPWMMGEKKRKNFFMSPCSYWNENIWLWT